jgi:hypothetical protein
MTVLPIVQVMVVRIMAICIILITDLSTFWSVPMKMRMATWNILGLAYSNTAVLPSIHQRDG